MTLDALFTPFTVGSVTLSNRFVMSPMTREFSTDGIPGPDVAAYYARRAAGGVGLIITEGSYIDHPTAVELKDAPRLFGSKPLDGWRAVIDGVHAHGGAIFAQLWHAGSERVANSAPFSTAPSVSPSGLTLEGTTGPHELTLAEIDELIAAYSGTAKMAQQLGFDGVEIHAAHGYLLDQFFWNRTNHRIDRFGGGMAARARFASEIVAEMRSAVGSTFPISLRISQWKIRNYDAQTFETPSDLEVALLPLADAGVSLFHVSTRRFWQPAFGTEKSLAAWVKKLTGTPTMAVGSVGLSGQYVVAEAGGPTASVSLRPVVEGFERGDFDLVAVGRPLLNDPLWLAKVRAGREGAGVFDPGSLHKWT